MGCNGLTRLVTAYALFVLGAAEAVALTPADKCEANKLKIAGKYGFCRLKAESKAVKTASSPDYSLCDLKLSEKWTTAETVGGGQCPTNGDLADIQSQATEDTDFLALKLTGVRYVDNGDGTVSDTQTGLMWEKKDELGGIHDKYNLYDWSATATAPDGEAFTIFLATLNNGTSTDGTTISGCFAGYCDWRLPTNAELQTILLEPYPCGTNPCVDPIFGPTIPYFYWSATTVAGDPDYAWTVEGGDGILDLSPKTDYLLRTCRPRWWPVINHCGLPNATRA